MMTDTNDSGLVKIRRALISVSDKTGIVDFARELRAHDFHRQQAPLAQPRVAYATLRR